MEREQLPTRAPLSPAFVSGRSGEMKLFSLGSGLFGWSSGLRNRGTLMRREETKSIRFVGQRHSKSLRLKTKNWKTNIVCTAQDAQMHHLLTARNENLKTL